MGVIEGSIALVGGKNSGAVNVTLTGGPADVALTDDGGSYAFVGVSAGTYGEVIEKTIVLSPDSGWQGRDGGLASLTLAATLPSVDFDGGGYLWPTPTLYPGDLLGQQVSSIIVSDGGQYYAYLSSTGALQVSSTANPGAPVSMGTSVGSDFQFSRVGSSVVFTDHEADGGPILDFSSATGPPVVVGDAFSYSMASDGQHLLALTDYNGNLDFGTLALTGLSGSPTTLGVEVPPSLYSFSPDGTQVAFVANFNDATAVGNLEVVNVATPTSVTTLGSYSSFAYSPDGRYLTYPTTTCTIAPTSNPAAIRRLGNEGGCMFSSNSAVVLFGTTDGGGHCPPFDEDCTDLEAADPAGSRATVQIGPFAFEGYQSIFLAPDGRFAAFTGDESPIYLANTSPPIVTTQLFYADELSDVLFSATDEYVALQAEQLYLAATASPGAVALLGEAGGAMFSLDESYLAFGLSVPEGQLLEVASTANVVADGGGEVPLSLNVDNFQFSPDSQYLAFESAPGLSVVAVSSSAPVELGPVSMWQFSPTGHELVFVTTSGMLGVYSPSGTAGTRLVAPAAGFSFSADGSYLAFVDNSQVLWTVAADGTGTPIPWLDNIYSASAWVGFNQPGFVWAGPTQILASGGSAAPYLDYGLYTFDIPMVSP